LPIWAERHCTRKASTNASNAKRKRFISMASQNREASSIGSTESTVSHQLHRLFTRQNTVNRCSSRDDATLDTSF
jgi:hypothetical protein